MKDPQFAAVGPGECIILTYVNLVVIMSWSCSIKVLAIFTKKKNKCTVMEAHPIFISTNN